jgi:hypothetical protein
VVARIAELLHSFDIHIPQSTWESSPKPHAPPGSFCPDGVRDDADPPLATAVEEVESPAAACTKEYVLVCVFVFVVAVPPPVDV